MCTLVLQSATNSLKISSFFHRFKVNSLIHLTLYLILCNRTPPLKLNRAIIKTLNNEPEAVITRVIGYRQCRIVLRAKRQASITKILCVYKRSFICDDALCYIIMLSQLNVTCSTSNHNNFPFIVIILIFVF